MTQFFLEGERRGGFSPDASFRRVLAWVSVLQQNCLVPVCPDANRSEIVSET